MTMGTRRWVGELESWLRRSGLSKEEVAKRSEQSTPHVLALFEQADPNPSLQLYLHVAHTAGARFHGVATNHPVEVIARLKEIAAREGIKTVSALAKAAGMNRSQLSSLLNDPDPNPTLAVFDRLVVALGAEQEFILVSYVDADVAQALAVGKAEVQAVRQEATARHLRAVPDLVPPEVKELARHLEAEAERAAAAEAQTKLAEVMDRAARLHVQNIALEKQHADDAAEIMRLHGVNANLERLRAEDAAEMARLIQANRDLERLRAEDAAEIARLSAANTRNAILFGLVCMATGAGIAAVAHHQRNP